MTLSTFKFYIKRQAGNASFAWSGTAMVATSSPLIFATQAEAETSDEVNAENTKVVTVRRVLQNFIYNIVNKTFTINGSSQTLIGALNSLFTGKQSTSFIPTTTLLSTTIATAIQEAASLGNKLQVIDTANWGANPTKTLTVNMFNRFTANQISTDSVTVALGAVTNTNLTNNFYFTFRTGATLPSAITFPTTNVKWLNNTPLTVANMAVNKIYEVLFEVLDTTTILASYGEF